MNSLINFVFISDYFNVFFDLKEIWKSCLYVKKFILNYFKSIFFFFDDILVCKNLKKNQQEERPEFENSNRRIFLITNEAYILQCRGHICSPRRDVIANVNSVTSYLRVYSRAIGSLLSTNRLLLFQQTQRMFVVSMDGNRAVNLCSLYVRSINVAFTNY